MPRRRRAISTAPLLPLDLDPSHPPSRRSAGPSTPTPAITDEMLKASADANARRFDADDEWRDSPFLWIRDLPTATRARAAEAILMDLLQEIGYLVQPRLGPGHDRLVEGLRVKVKFSTRWSSGSYTFQQVRDGSYDVLLLFGLSPSSGHLWAVPHAAVPGLLSAAWISVDPSSPPDSMLAFGGALESVTAALHATFGPPSAPTAQR